MRNLNSGFGPSRVSVDQDVAGGVASEVGAFLRPQPVDLDL